MNRTTVEQIKERLPIDVVIGSYVKLDKAGKSYKAKCPFHNEKSPSFFVSPDRGGYYCFGCGAKGDIFSFVEQFEGLDFRGALKILAERAGVPLVYDTKADSERDRQFQLMELAAKYFEEQFAKSKEAQEYVKSRGLSEDSRRDFRVGWAPDGWRNLANTLKLKGWSDAMMEKVGLVKKKEEADKVESGDRGLSERSVSGASSAGHERTSLPASSNSSTNNHYDRFRGRIMFPITDSSGRVIAFTGRILKDDGKSAKYLNSPDTPLYDKSMVLYGLNKAKSEIRRMGYSIFVEGQMDLIMSHQAGVKNTVAASGTALGDEAVNEQGIVSNLGLVRRLSPNIIIAFDSDNAGRKAALRASGIALSLGMDVKIADIVGGKDPADLVKEDIEQWKTVLRVATPVVEFELNNVVREFADAEPASARKIPRAIIERVLPLLARIESASDQSYYVRMIADKTSIPTDAVWQDLKMVITKQKEKDVATPVAKAAGVSSIKNVSATNNSTHRIDLAERQLFGMLFLFGSNGGNDPKELVEYTENLKNIAGDTFVDRLARAEALKSDLMFEAENYFGADKTRWNLHAKELFLNFEEDVVNEGLFQAMQELRQSEKVGNMARAEEYAKKCQVLSIRKAEILKKGK